MQNNTENKPAQSKHMKILAVRHGALSRERISRIIDELIKEDKL